MSTDQLWRSLSRRTGAMFLTGLLGASLAFFVLTLVAHPFRAVTDLLVVQNTPNQDFYTLFKSSEFISKVLAEATLSEKFIGAVVETGKVNQEFLPFDKEERLKAWRRMVSVEKNTDLGLLRVVVQSDNEREAGRLSDAITSVLVEKNQLFRGGDAKSVELRLLSGPITMRQPTLAQIVASVVAGFVVGVVLQGLYTALRRGSDRAYEGLAFPRDLLNRA